VEASRGNALIVLSRKQRSWRDILRRYLVMLDGEQVAKVRRGQVIELPVSAGQHAIFLKIDWCSSPTVEVDAQPSEAIRLRSEPAGSALYDLFAIVSNAEAYIALTRV
jgi:hypothetical protein